MAQKKISDLDCYNAVEREKRLSRQAETLRCSTRTRALTLESERGHGEGTVFLSRPDRGCNAFAPSILKSSEIAAKPYVSAPGAIGGGA